MTRPTITVAYFESDVDLASVTATYLDQCGIHTHVFQNPAAGIDFARQVPIDVVLLSFDAVDHVGEALCRTLRRHIGVSIVVLGTKDSVSQRIRALEGGPDDYLAKPFSPRELVARIRAHARRSRFEATPAAPVLRVGKLEVDVPARETRLGGRRLQLTAYEFELLRAFAEQPGIVLSRTALVQRVHGKADEALSRSVDFHLSHLRRKLADDARYSTLLKTVRGVGYVLAPQKKEGRTPC